LEIILIGIGIVRERGNFYSVGVPALLGFSHVVGFLRIVFSFVLLLLLILFIIVLNMT